MNELDYYFRNRVAMMGKVIAFKEETPDYQTFLLETKEIWADGETLREVHEMRYYTHERHPPLIAADITGQLVEIDGRVRLKEPGASDYRPYIQCMSVQPHAA